MAVGATDVLLFSGSQFDHAHNFSLGFSRREAFFGSVLFLLLWLVVGFVVLWHLVFSLFEILFVY